MSVKIKATVLGLAELEDALIELGSEVAGKNGGFVRSSLMAAALPVLRDAQARAPVGPSKEGHAGGTLKKQIKRNRVKNPRAYNELVTIGVPWPQWAPGKHAVLLNDTYGAFVEFGTVKQSAQPFLRPALESNKEKSTKIFSTTLGRKIRSAAKKIGKKNLARVGQ